jgi:Co/Zn/Cd efflux system component
MRLEPFEWVGVVAGAAFAVLAIVSVLDGQIAEAAYDSMFAIYLLYMAAWHFRRRQTGDGGILVGSITGVVFTTFGVSAVVAAVQRFVDDEQPLWGVLLLASGLGILLLGVLALVVSTLVALVGLSERRRRRRAASPGP